MRDEPTHKLIVTVECDEADPRSIYVLVYVVVNWSIDVATQSNDYVIMSYVDWNLQISKYKHCQYNSYSYIFKILYFARLGFHINM